MVQVVVPNALPKSSHTLPKWQILPMRPAELVQETVDADARGCRHAICCLPHVPFAARCVTIPSPAAIMGRFVVAFTSLATSRMEGGGCCFHLFFLPSASSGGMGVPAGMRRLDANQSRYQNSASRTRLSMPVQENAALRMAALHMYIGQPRFEPVGRHRQLQQPPVALVVATVAAAATAATAAVDAVGTAAAAAAAEIAAAVAPAAAAADAATASASGPASAEPAPGRFSCKHVASGQPRPAKTVQS